MKNLNIIVLIVALAAIGLGVLLSSGNRQTEIQSDSIFPELQSNIDAVDTLIVSDANGVLLEATLADGVWGSASHGQYPLEQEKVVKLLNALIKAKLDSAKTAKAENHARLGLQDLEAQDSQSQLLEIKTGDKHWQLLVGNGTSSGNGVFVRKPGENQTWLSKAELQLPNDASDWLQQQILNIPFEEIVAISRPGFWRAEVLNTDGDEADSKEWTMLNIPEGRSLKYESIVSNTAENILELELEALLQEKPMDFTDATLLSKIQLETVTKGVISIELYQSNSQYLAVYNNDNSNAPWTKWVFGLSQFYADRLTKNIDSFLAELPQEPDVGTSDVN